MISARVVYDDKSKANTRLIFRAETLIPAEWAKRFRANVRGMNMTPMKTGRLRRSILTQALGNQAIVVWRSPYARAQEYGGHLYPGQYKNYTKAGTGPGFGKAAFRQTNAEMSRVVREIGLIR